MDAQDTASLLTDAPAPTPTGQDPLFALLAAHRPRLTRAVVLYATGLSAHRWRNLRRGQVNWAWSDLRALAPLLDETPAALAAHLEASGRYVRPEGRRKSPRHTCPTPRRPRTVATVAHPSGSGPRQAA